MTDDTNLPEKAIEGNIRYWREDGRWHLGITGPDWLLDDLKSELVASSCPIHLKERETKSSALYTYNPHGLSSGGTLTQMTPHRLLELSFPAGDGIKLTGLPLKWPLIVEDDGFTVADRPWPSMTQVEPTRVTS